MLFYVLAEWNGEKLVEKVSSNNLSVWPIKYCLEEEIFHQKKTFSTTQFVCPSIYYAFHAVDFLFKNEIYLIYYNFF